MAESIIENKWDQRYQAADIHAAKTSRFLQQHHHSLPKSGIALDLACGLGGNSIFLAKLGWQVEALDQSSVVCTKLAAFARSKNLDIRATHCDLEQVGSSFNRNKQQYDLITVSYYLHRPLFSTLLAKLKTNGCLIYQTWTVNKASGVGPNHPNFLLKTNELLSLCHGLKVIHYQEDIACDDSHTGNKLIGEAAIMAIRC